MSVAIPNVLLSIHVCCSDWARLELIMVMGLSNVASFHFACKMRNWAVIEEVSDLSTDFAPVVLLSVGYSETWCPMVELS